MKSKLLIITLLLLPFLAKSQFCNYTYHAPISLTGASGTLIQGDSLTSITLTSCSNVHIFKCKIANKTSGQAIRLIGCVNITIDSCFLENDQQGIYAENCTNIIVNHNYLHNIIGAASPATYHPIQFVTCTRGQINYNKILEDPITTQYTHDQISLYKSNGVLGDSIQVIGNWIRGGQTQMNGSGPGGYTGGNNGATGINPGDSGGSYQVVRGNYIINGGYIGLQLDGAATHCKVDHNFVFSTQTNISLVGVSYYTTGSTPGPTSNYIGYNLVNWKKNDGSTFNKWYNPALNQPTGWTTNSPDGTGSSSANSTMIPTPMVTACGSALQPPNCSYSSYIGTFKTAMLPMSPVNVGGAAASFTATLPSGLSINSTTGIITGIPQAAATITSYQVIATNSAGADTTTFTLTVNKANLAVIADTKYKTYGTINPTLTLSYQSSIIGDTSPVLTSYGIASTSVTQYTAPGTYTITASGASSPNYNISYVTGALIIYPVTVGGVVHGHKAKQATM